MPRKALIFSRYNEGAIAQHTRIDNALAATSSDWTQYQGRELEFIREILNYTLTPDQESATRHIWGNPETNIPSCHGAGKTLLCALQVFVAVYVWEKQVITTAPTARQVKLLLWKEIQKIFRDCKKRGIALGGIIYKIPRLDYHKANAAVGYTGNTDNAFQGVHDPMGVFVILDEACGIEDSIDEAATACTVDATLDKIVRVGNPVRCGGAFEKACLQSSHPIAAWTHPNIAPYYDRHADGIHRLKPGLNDPLKLRQLAPIIPGGITPQWIERMRDRYGEGSLFWKTRIEGVFPTANVDQLLTRELMAIARQPSQPPELSKCLRLFGMDPGDGGDASATCELWRLVRADGRKEYWVRSLSELEGLHDGLETNRLLEHLKGRMRGAIVGAIDRTGIGTGLYGDCLKEGLDIEGVYVGGRARDASAFINLRAEGYWTIRTLIAQGLLHIPEYVGDRLDEELLAHDYEESEQNHKIKMASKAKVKGKLKRSPNLSDALLLAILRGEMEN
jgi:hypothetical protein